MLLAAIVPAVNPWPWTATEVGACPRKLKLVPEPPVEKLTHGLIVNVPVPIRPEVAPVAVMVLSPPAESANTNVADPEVQLPRAFVVQEAGNESVVIAVEVKDTDSEAPNPLTDNVSVIVVPGNPVCLAAVRVWLTFELTVKEAVAGVVPSVTVMV